MDSRDRCAGEIDRLVQERLAQARALAGGRPGATPLPRRAAKTPGDASAWPLNDFGLREALRADSARPRAGCADDAEGDAVSRDPFGD